MTTDPRPSTDPRRELDARLVGEALAGRPAAFPELVRAYQSRIYGLLLQFTRQPQEAQDLTQEVFVAAWKSLPRFDRSRSFRNWVLKIATHHGLQHLRRRGRPPPPPELPAPALDPLEFQVRADDHARLRTASGRLEQDLRLVVWLYYFFERSCKEIADLLEISESLVKVRLFRARRTLGVILRELEASGQPV